jgi:ABC-type tungstate transport system permease subunit
MNYPKGHKWRAGFSNGSVYQLAALLTPRQGEIAAVSSFLIGREGQKVIAGYKIDGQRLFYPNANDPNA